MSANLSISSISIGKGSTLGGTWIQLKGSGFYWLTVSNAEPYVYFTFGAAPPQQLPLQEGYQWYVVDDNEMWVLSPPAASLVGLPSNEPPPYNVLIVVSANGAGLGNAPFSYQYWPDVNINIEGVLWTGENSFGTITLNETAQPIINGTPQGSETWVTLLSSTGVELLGNGTNQGSVSLSGTETTTKFVITTALTATGTATITATGPDQNQEPVTATAEISAGQIVAYLSALPLEAPGYLTSGQAVSCTLRLPENTRIRAHCAQRHP